MDIEYDKIKDEISRMESVEYSTGIGIHFMNVYNMEDFADL